MCALGHVSPRARPTVPGLLPDEAGGLFPVHLVPSVRMSYQGILQWSELRVLTQEDILYWQSRPNVYSARRCAACLVNAGPSGWVTCGPFGLTHILNCATCGHKSEIRTDEPGCTPWLVRGKDCLACHTKRPEYQEIYTLKAKIERERSVSAKALKMIERRMTKRGPPPTVAGVVKRIQQIRKATNTGQIRKAMNTGM